MTFTEDEITDKLIKEVVNAYMTQHTKEISTNNDNIHDLQEEKIYSDSLRGITNEYIQNYANYIYYESEYKQKLINLLNIDDENVEITIIQNNGLNIKLSPLITISSDFLHELDSIFEDYYIHRTSKGMTIIADFKPEYIVNEEEL